MKQVGFIGMGNMGYAIAKGLKSTNPDLKIVFHSNTAEKMQKISEELDIRSVEDNRTVVKEAKYIILAVKPQVFDEIFAEISDSIRKDHVIISLARYSAKCKNCKNNAEHSGFGWRRDDRNHLS